MTRYFAVKRSDGGVSIMQIFDDSTPEQVIAKWHPEQRAAVMSVHPVNKEDIPEDRSARPAWAETLP